MKRRDPLHLYSALLAFGLAVGFPAANAAEPAVGASKNVESKLSSEFGVFLGGTDQAHAVVEGLRQGTAFVYVKAGAPDATIEPPTGTMGYGNVRIALRLAQAELAEFGIVQPTGEELSAILLGGEIDGAPVDGILALRAEGMGWGQIAQQYGTTVGQLMGKGPGLTKQPSAPSRPGTQAARGAPGKTAHSPQAHANGYIPSGKAAGSGIVSGTGESVAVIEPNGGKGLAHKPTANTHGGGTAAAGGQQASLAGASNAGGATALAPGLAKKN